MDLPMETYLIARKKKWFSHFRQSFNHNQLKMMFEGIVYIPSKCSSFKYSDDTCTHVSMYCHTGGSVEEVTEGSSVWSVEGGGRGGRERE